MAAVLFLTRIPVSPLFPREEFDHRLALQKSVRFFPLVGLMIGCFTSVVFSSVSFVWSTAVAACIAIAAESWLTGAFHEDAFADATDALGGGWTKERVLEILKDSRHGTFGVLALAVLHKSRSDSSKCSLTKISCSASFSRDGSFSQPQNWQS